MSEDLPYASTYQQLLAYKKAVALAELIFEVTKSFPREELYSLTNQIRRSSRSPGAQIAEAWGKRLYRKHFISKLSDAIAEVNETEHWIDIAYRCNYISHSVCVELFDICSRTKSLVHGMIGKADLFCRPKK